MSGEMVPYVVRQGDYLVKLGWVHGFDADKVWNGLLWVSCGSDVADMAT